MFWLTFFNISPFETNFDKVLIFIIFSYVFNIYHHFHNFLLTFSPFVLILNKLIVLLTNFNVGNGISEDVEAEHDLEFQFALYQDDQSDLEFSQQINDN